jgi:dsRNA-specific ribonuclease
VNGVAAARGEGGSKREAERAAAQALLTAAGVDV